MIAASTGLAITAANLVWYILRRLGLWTVEQGSRGPHGHACCRIAGGCRAHVHAVGVVKCLPAGRRKISRLQLSPYEAGAVRPGATTSWARTDQPVT